MDYKFNSIDSDNNFSNDNIYDNEKFFKQPSNTKIYLSTTLSTETSNRYKSLNNNYYKHKSILNEKLIKSFHKDYIREKFQEKKKLQNTIPEKKIENEFISSYIYKKNYQRNNPIRLNFHINSVNTSINNSHRNSFLNKTYVKDNSIEKKLIENKSDFNTFIKSYLPKIRAENVNEFKDKIKLEIKGKYLLSYQKEIKNDFNLKIENKIKECNNNISKCKNNLKLFKIYCDTYDSYDNKLSINKLLEFENNEFYKIKINNLKSDIQRIKNKINNNIIILKELFEIKCYLMSVKNHTKLIEKFPKEDLLDLKYDNQLISMYIDIIKEENKKKVELPFSRKNYKRTQTLFGYLHNSKQSSSLDSNNEKIHINTTPNINYIHRNELMFKDVNEFNEHMNNITDKIIISMKNYNDIRRNINYRKDLIKSMSKDNYDKIKENKILKDIKHSTKNLFYKKKIFEEKEKIIEKLNLKKNKKKEQLHIKINDIFHNLEKYIVYEKKKENQDELNDIKKIHLIENLFINLLKEKEEYKNKYSEMYDKIIKRLEREKKIENAKITLKKQNENFFKKLNKIFEKSNKLIIKPRKKIGEKLYLMNKKKKNNNDKNKTLENNNYELLEY